MKPRYIENAIRSLALERHKMAFVSGPRQAGKTTLGKRLISELGGDYFSWDDVAFRRRWVKEPASLVRDGHGGLCVFDEIHKGKGWKGTIKGLYDLHGREARILVTGSARLNVYRRGGDSLLGRYLNFRLHPFSLGEVVRNRHAAILDPDAFMQKLLECETWSAGDRAQSTLSDLLQFSGFPEPFLERSVKLANLWRRGRLEKIVREDLRDLSRLPELSQVEMLTALLPEKVGSLLSVQSLREDLEVAHTTVRRWLNYLGELYYHYELKPYSTLIARSLRKEGKLYLWDWSEVEQPGPRYENLVGGHLLKACHFWTDTGEGAFELFYLRDKEKREIDFLITRDRKPWLAVEAKLADRAPSSHWAAFARHLRNIPFVQLVAKATKPKCLGQGVFVAGAADILSILP